MKKPDRLVGYLKLNDSDCAFEFNDDNFTLSLYPPTTKDYDIQSVLEGVTGFNHKEHKWIENFKLTGVTSSGSNIIFNVQDFPSNYNGFKVYDVNWYFCYYNTLNDKSIEGFRIKGPEIDLFYPPQRALTTKIDFSEEYKKVVFLLQFHCLLHILLPIRSQHHLSICFGLNIFRLLYTL